MQRHITKISQYIPKTTIHRFYNKTTKEPQLTKDRYGIKRGNFSVVTETDLNKFQSILGASILIFLKVYVATAMLF